MPARIAYIVSPHGFGHGARSAAVLNALWRLRPEIEAHVFTTVPEWFWQDSLDRPFELHEVLTDVGLVQLSPTEEDPQATLRRLDEIRPLAEKAKPMVAELDRLGCDFVVCDISPLGLAAAGLAGLPSVLVESFTWDWIYESYFEAEPGLREVAEEMAELCASAGVRIQTEPVCRPATGSIVVPPVYRRGRSNRAAVRSTLGLSDDRPLVLVTMGGSSWAFEGADHLKGASDLAFVVFAGTAEIERRDNVILLPVRSPVFVPDLIAAADVVVGKLGYSTVAEAWAAGSRYLFVPRPRFPESPFLAAFVREHLPSVEVSPAAFALGAWVESLEPLLAEQQPTAQTINGADRIARELLRTLG
jgi:hypothetical protein